MENMVHLRGEAGPPSSPFPAAAVAAGAADTSSRPRRNSQAAATAPPATAGSRSGARAEVHDIRFSKSPPEASAAAAAGDASNFPQALVVNAAADSIDGGSSRRRTSSRIAAAAAGGGGTAGLTGLEEQPLFAGALGEWKQPPARRICRTKRGAAGATAAELVPWAEVAGEQHVRSGVAAEGVRKVLREGWVPRELDF
jgi:hypothetical protein